MSSTGNEQSIHRRADAAFLILVFVAMCHTCVCEIVSLSVAISMHCCTEGHGSMTNTGSIYQIVFWDVNLFICTENACMMMMLRSLEQALALPATALPTGLDTGPFLARVALTQLPKCKGLKILQATQQSTPQPMSTKNYTNLVHCQFEGTISRHGAVSRCLPTRYPADFV